MKYEDFSVPVFYLQKGVDKLLTYGMPTFELYADEVGLSYCDRNRVIAKCKFISPDKGFREVPCPDNLIRDRWNYFTCSLRYSEKKARSILKLVDDSFNASMQFVPDPKVELARPANLQINWDIVVAPPSKVTQL